MAKVTKHALIVGIFFISGSVVFSNRTSSSFIEFYIMGPVLMDIAVDVDIRPNIIGPDVHHPQYLYKYI